MEVGAVPAFIGHHVSLEIPSEKLEDDEKTIYTNYAPLGVCGGQSCSKSFFFHVCCANLHL